MFPYVIYSSSINETASEIKKCYVAVTPMYCNNYGHKCRPKCTLSHSIISPSLCFDYKPKTLSPSNAYTRGAENGSEISVYCVLYPKCFINQ
jgi:hypothetical protein